MNKRGSLKYGQSFFQAQLVLHRATDIYARLYFFPIVWQACNNTLRPFGYYIEAKVIPCAHHAPSLATLGVHLLDKEVG